MTIDTLFLKTGINLKYYYKQFSLTPIKFKADVNLDGPKKLFNFITQNINLGN